MLLHSQIVGEGRPLVILHGFLGMGDNWRTLANKISELGFQVHLIDARNHGRSFHSDHFSYMYMVSDLVQYCEHYDLEKISIIGHSMGGKTAMLFSIYFPELISKLVVVDISPRSYPEHHQKILSGLSSLDFGEIKTRQEAEDVLSDHIKEKSIRQFLLKNLYWKTKGKLALRINLPVLIKNIREIGKSLPTNTTFEGEVLFLKGESSSYVEAADEKLIKIHFPGSKIAVVSRAGHWLHSENPSEFYDYLKEFL